MEEEAATIVERGEGMSIGLQAITGGWSNGDRQKGLCGGNVVSRARSTQWLGLNEFAIVETGKQCRGRKVALPEQDPRPICLSI